MMTERRMTEPMNLSGNDVRELVAGLHGGDGAREQADDEHEHQRLHADVVHLVHDQPERAQAAPELAERVADEHGDG